MEVRPARVRWRFIIAAALFLIAVTLVLTVMRSPGMFTLWDFSVELPQGYKLIELYSNAVCLSNPVSEIIVEPEIDGYYVYSDLIVGHTTKDPHPHSFRSVQGYFIVDMRTSKVEQGLSYCKWKNRLREYGIKSAPTLRTPWRYDPIFGYNKPHQRR